MLCETISINRTCKWGFDIRSTEKSRIDELKALYKIKIGKAEEDLHEDNCKEKVCECSWDVKIKMSPMPREGCMLVIL